MNPFRKPKLPPMPEIKIPELPEPPKPDPEIERRKKEEAERAEAQRIAEIEKRLRSETAFFSNSRGSGRGTLLSSGRKGFSLRSLLSG